MRRDYPQLEIYLSFLVTFAWVILLISIIGSFVLFISNIPGTSLLGILLILAGILGVFFTLAITQLIRVFIDTESNTNNTSEYISSILEYLKSEQNKKNYSNINKSPTTYYVNNEDRIKTESSKPKKNNFNILEALIYLKSMNAIINMYESQGKNTKFTVILSNHTHYFDGDVELIDFANRI